MESAESTAPCAAEDCGAAADGHGPNWFELLPHPERERVVAEDLAKMERWETVLLAQRRGWRRPALQAALLFFLVGFNVTGYQLAPASICLVLGASTGVLWHLCDAGQLLAPLIAVPLFLLALLVADHLSFAALAFAPIGIGSVSAYIGMRRGEPPGA